MFEPKTGMPPGGVADAAGGQARGAALPPGSRRVNGYVAAVALVAIAFGLRYGLYGGLDNRLPFGFFLPAAMLAARYGGMGPGMLAAVSGLLLGDYFFLPPHHAWGPLGEAERTALGVYAVTSTLAVILIGNLKNRVCALECELARRPAAAPAVPSSAPASGREAAS